MAKSDAEQPEEGLLQPVVLTLSVVDRQGCCHTKKNTQKALNWFYTFDVMLLYT